MLDCIVEMDWREKTYSRHNFYLQMEMEMGMGMDGNERRQLLDHKMACENQTSI